MPMKCRPPPKDDTNCETAGEKVDRTPRERLRRMISGFCLITCCISSFGCARQIWTGPAWRDVDGLYGKLQGVNPDTVTLGELRPEDSSNTVATSPEFASTYTGAVDLIAQPGKRLYFSYSDPPVDAPEGRVLATFSAPPTDGRLSIHSCFAAPRLSFVVSCGVQVQAPPECERRYLMRPGNFDGPPVLEIRVSLPEPPDPIILGVLLRSLRSFEGVAASPGLTAATRP